MPINILTSPPASGKTRYCVQRVSEVRKDHPNTDIWVLVPDGYQAKAFRTKIAENGGGLGVNVVTFDNLLREILEKTGNSVSLAPITLEQAFIRRAIEKVSQQGNLSHFEAISDLPGFVSALQERFAELKRGMIYPEIFLDYSRNQSPPVKELAQVYSEYQALLIENNWADPEGLSWLAIEFIENHPDWDPGWPLLVLDGFDSFTQPQIKALDLLSEKIPEILITLPGTEEMTRQAHQRFAETFQVLCSLSESNLLPVMYSPHLPKVLSRLEAKIGEGKVAPRSTEDDVVLIEARSPAEEAREALRWLKSKIIRDGFDLEKCVVIVPEPSIYNPHLRAVADEFGLPIEFSVGQRVAETPLYAALESLLQLSLRDFPRRLVLDTIRSPYFNLALYRLTSQDANILDLLSQTQQVVGGYQVWLDSLEVLAEKSEGEVDWADDEELRIPQLPSGSVAERIQKSLKGFFDRIVPPIDEKSLIEWVAWLEDLLEELGFWQTPTFEADTNTQATSRQMLRELVLTETVTGIQKYTYQTFLEILKESARRTEVLTASWSQRPAIKVLRIVEGRGLRHDAVAILGLSEGIFPRSQKEDPFLTEKIRNEIGLESAFDQHQIGLFYQAVTRADRQILLSRPFLSSDGEVWEASPFWEEVRRMYSDGYQKIVGDGDRLLSDAGSPPELLAWATSQGSIAAHVKEKLAYRAARVLHGRHVLESRLLDSPPSVYNGSLSKESLQMDESISDTAWSASRLESYLTCPHFYFSSKQLELEALQEPDLGMDVAQRGSIMHRILERVFRECNDPTDLESLLNTLEVVAMEVLTSAPKEYGFRPTPLWNQEQSEIKNRLEKTIVELHQESTGWMPFVFEASFGIGENPPLSVELGVGEINIRGLIDRVDKDKDGNIRIIDYKLGSSKLGNQDLESGQRIQLPIYGLAARDALGLGEPIDGLYWVINQAKSGSLTLQKYGFNEAVKTALMHVDAALKGIAQADFKPSAPKGGCPSYCPAATWCWAYEPQGSW